MIVAAFGSPPPAAAIEAAAAALAAGGVIGLATDTVYGLAGGPERIYELKQRPAGLALPVLVADRAQVEAAGGPVPALAARLMDRFWPGALTIVVARSGATVGYRSPDHPVPLALCRAVGPLPSTSANLHGQPPLETAAEVEAAFGDDLALVLDAGPCTGSPSTVVDCTGDRARLLRTGRVPWEDVLAAGG